MGYPARLLGEGEEIEVVLRTHWKALIGPVLVLLLTCAAAAFAIAVLPPGGFQGPLAIAILVAAFVVLGRWTVWPWLVGMTDIPHVEDIQREVYRLVEADAGRRRREIRDDEYEIDGT